METAWTVCVLVCLWAQYTVLHCSSNTRNAHRMSIFVCPATQYWSTHRSPKGQITMSSQTQLLQLMGEISEFKWFYFGPSARKSTVWMPVSVNMCASSCSPCACMNSPQHKLTAYDGCRVVAGEYLTHTLHLRQAVITVKSEALCQETLLHSETHNYRLDPDEKN